MKLDQASWHLMLVLIGLVATAPALAQKSWLGGVDGNWHSAGNWSPVGVPTLADSVLIDGPEGAVWPQIAQATGLAQSLVVGQGQHGQLTLGQLAVLTTDSLLLAEQADSQASLSIEGVVGGQLDAPAVLGGAGHAELVFRHNQSNYEFRRPGGAAIDTGGSLLLVHDQFASTRLLGQHSHSGGTRVSRGDLDLFGGQLSHPGAALAVAPDASDIGALFLRNGAQADVGPTLVAGGAGSFANLQVGTNSTLTIHAPLLAGVSGTAFVDVAGGVLNAPMIRVGSDLPESGQSTLSVLGAFARLFVSGDVELGGPAGHARCHIFSGGQAEIDGNFRVGLGTGGTAELELGVVASLVVDGQLSFDSQASLRLGIDVFSHGAIQAGSVVIAPGARLEVPEPADPPASGSSFIVLETTGGISGSFTTVDLPTGWQLLQEANRLRIALVESDEIFADRFQ